jgi:alanine racemase
LLHSLAVCLPVYLKLDTGMHRLGLTADEFAQVLVRLEAADCTASIAVMTHFADADEERGIAEQMHLFAHND